ncbi:MAG: hypothetical protein K0S61_3359 [Anaerocolumna sp.]|jgi:hypothetical protein|nr:hypothetical protein [Anaerocolumna sp.]
MSLFDKIFKKSEEHNHNLKQENSMLDNSKKNEQEALIEYEIVEKEILPEKMICPDCGGITLVGLDFCDKCGGELAGYDNY